MEKIKIQKTIFSTQKDNPFTWADIKNIQFEDDDVIEISWVGSSHSDNDYYGPYWSTEVSRMVEETDEQLQERIREKERNDKWAKEKRYERYLKLKEEFENK